ncbi:XRE family transcriptional regulator [Micromonospora sp. NPDC005174]|uniref:helix-turn-helix domain-containing protein n=1 Tax=Micromonospora sp. NPDC005174 TaxID=3157018 RepID=UPI0033AF7BA7
MRVTATSFDAGDERDYSFSPSRLKLARELRGLTKQQLADTCGVTRRTVSSWEAGDTGRPPLRQLADVLQLPIDFFMADDVSAVSKESVSFRALSTMSARQVHRVLASATLACQLSSWMDQHYDTPDARLPELNETYLEDPRTAAARVRATWNLGHTPIKNMASLLERQGVRLFSLPSTDREVDAFSFWREKRPFVFLNTSKSAERLRFDLAHELGHLILHRGIFTKRDRKYELEAHDFAANFLVPEDGLRAQLKGHPTFNDIFILKRYWKVSAIAMTQRLYELRIISEWTRRSWMVDLSQRGFRSTEPGGGPAEGSTLLRELFKMAREDGWGSRKIAQELKVHEQEVDSLVFGLAVSAIDGGGQSAPAVTGHLRVVK